ncbi:MAG: hypothetical protein Q9160_003141 [Pyrenula sp. 1 TL-2023]
MAQHHVKRRKLSHNSIRDGASAIRATNLSEDSASDTTSSDLHRTQPASANSKPNLSKGSAPLKARSRGQNDDLLLASSSYKSSLLKIQLDELLSEVSVNYRESLPLYQSAVRRLEDIIRGLRPKDPLSVQDAEKSLRKSAGIEIPFPEPRPGKETNYQFAFYPPARTDVVEELGQVESDGTITTDLAVQIPEELFQEKDYLNYRCFHKRAYYIACIAAGVQASARGEFRLSYGYESGNLLLPTLLVNPGDKAAHKEDTPQWCIQVVTDLPTDIFPTKRTLPFLNCIRSKVLKGPEAEIDRSPTPFYNGTLRSEATNASYRQLLQSTAAICDSFRDFCVLGQVWLRQRGFARSVQSVGFGGREWALCCALLIEDNGGARSMFSRYTSYQLFKTMLQFLGTKDLTTPVLLNGEGIQFPKTNQPVLYDCGRNFNVLYKMQRWSYEHLKIEALFTLRALSDRQRDYFDATFIAKVNEPALRYDHLLGIDISNLRQPSIPQNIFLDKLNKLYDVLTRGLGDRVKAINLLLSEPQRHLLSEKEKVDLNGSHLTIGVILDPESAERIVDRGPSPEQKIEIAEFRKFWGDKAELRRFKDGTISESLVWKADSQELIVSQIIRLLLHRHFQLDAQGVDLGARLAQASTLRDLDMTLGHEPFRPLDTAFESLNVEINQLDGLPLSIRSIMATDPAMRYNLLRTPSETAPSNLDVVLQFEGSARWPDNLLAIQRTKVAFLIKLGELLESSMQNTTARVGLESQSAPLQNQAFLDIALHPTAKFRLRIHHDREELLLSRDLKSKDISSLGRESASQALLAYKRTFIHSPLHTQSLRALCTRHPSLPAAIRLLKKWISSHLLTPFLPQPLVELLAVSVYTDPKPWDTPSTPLTAFLRTLNLLSRWRWPSSPLIVDLNPSSSSSNSSSFTATDLQTIYTNFTAWRKLDPDMNTVSLFLASSIDHSGVVWTQGAHPPKVVAARLSSLANAAVEVVKSGGLELSVGRLFNTPMEDYDFLIHLDERFTRAGIEKRQGKMGQKYKNLQAGSAAFDYKEILELFMADAARVLGGNALLFHGEDGEPVIAGLWNPRSLTKRQWRVRMGFSAKVADGEGEQVAMNTEGMLAEVGLIGEGIVKRIEIVQKKAT